MKNAIWISRHPCSTEQMAEIEAKGYCLVGVEDGLALGSIDLQEDADVAAWLKELDRLLNLHQVSAAFGVLPAPLQAKLANYPNEEHWGMTWLPFYLAWNVSRSVDGGRPTFTHKKFLDTYLVF